MIAEAEVGGDGRDRCVVCREDEGVVLGEAEGAVIDVEARLAHGCVSAITVEDVVEGYRGMQSPARPFGILVALIDGTEIALLDELLMRRDLIGQARLLQTAHVLIARLVYAPVAYEGIGIRLLEGLGQSLGL